MLVAAVCPVQADGDPAFYRVRKGDNLTRIAGRFGVTVADLNQANKLASDLIHVGQKLKISYPFRRSKAAEIRWRPPLEGHRPVLKEFGPYKNSQGVLMPQTGVDVGTPVGSTVRCPAHGVIRYIGPQEGFGTLIIIEHGVGYSTVLAPLQESSIAWRQNDAVLRGDIIGKSDQPPVGDHSYFHLELRKRGKAVKPDRLIR